MPQPEDIDGTLRWNLADVISWLNEKDCGRLLDNMHADDWFHETAGTETIPDDIESLVSERKGIK